MHWSKERHLALKTAWRLCEFGGPPPERIASAGRITRHEDTSDPLAKSHRPETASQDKTQQKGTDHGTPSRDPQKGKVRNAASQRAAFLRRGEPNRKQLRVTRVTRNRPRDCHAGGDRNRWPPPTEQMTHEFPAAAHSRGGRKPFCRIGWSAFGRLMPAERYPPKWG
jgi:hypothetical protein